jgi:hypothetical protein
MLSVLIVGGGLLGVLFGGVLRASFGPRGLSNSRKLGLAIAVLTGAVIAGLFRTLLASGQLPQLYCYLASVLTGYIVTAMLEGATGKHPGVLSKGAEPKISPVRAWADELITES